MHMENADNKFIIIIIAIIVITHTLFMTKNAKIDTGTAEKPYPLGLHMPIEPLY